MRPIANRVLVLVPPEPSDAKVGDLFLPNSREKNQYPEAKVIGVGPKCVDVKAGDTVIIDRYAVASLRVRYQDKEHFLLAEPDVIGIINK